MDINFSIQNHLSKDKPFFLEFRQLKEYYNFRIKFKADKNDKSKHGILFQQGYYLIDKNWLNEWKQIIGYQKFHDIRLNREINENDYSAFLGCLPPNIRELKIGHLDNANIYGKDGNINPFAEFVIINKECQKVFEESSLNKNVEKSCPLMFTNGKIILCINKFTRVICYRDEQTKKDIEIIIIFKNDLNIDNIFEDIKKSKIKEWLENRNFYSYGPDELNIEEKHCQIKLINKNLKLINARNFNQHNHINNNFDNKNNMSNKDIVNLNKIIQNQANEIDKLKEENEKLKKDLIRSNKIISDMQNNQINNNNKELKNLRDEINKLQNQLILKEKELKDVKNKFQNNTKKEAKVYYSDIMVINFSSVEVNYGIKCLPTDTFAEVEEKLYQKYDDLRNTNNMFTANAQSVLRVKTISENNIKDGDIIQLTRLV